MSSTQSPVEPEATPQRTGMSTLESKVVVVTGAGSGIGRAVAECFAAAGSRVVATDIDGGAARATASRLSGGGHDHGSLDVSDPVAVDSVFGDFDRVDVLVNSAGIREIREPLELPADEWSAVIAVNLSGTFFCIQAVAPFMVAQGAGSIVNIASVAGLRGFGKRPAYSASKAGVIGLTRSLSQDLIVHGVRVNAICPGLIPTGMTEAYFEDEAFLAQRSTRVGHPHRRGGARQSRWHTADAGRCRGGELR